MKVTIDMENLGSVVEGILNNNLTKTVENEIAKIVSETVNSQIADVVETIVNEKLSSYVNEYITTTTISVGGGWNSEPKIYTADEYIKMKISEIMNEQKLRITDGYGKVKYVSFEDYVKSVFDVDRSVKKSLEEFMNGVKKNVTNNINNMFNTTTRAALSDVMMNMLNNSNTFLEMQDNLKRITDGN